MTRRGEESGRVSVEHRPSNLLPSRERKSKRSTRIAGVARDETLHVRRALAVAEQKSVRVSATQFDQHRVICV